MKYYFFAWLALCLVALAIYRTIDWGTGCDGGLCLIPPFLLACCWGLLGVVIVIVRIISQLTKKK